MVSIRVLGFYFLVITYLYVQLMNLFLKYVLKIINPVVMNCLLGVGHTIISWFLLISSIRNSFIHLLRLPCPIYVKRQQLDVTQLMMFSYSMNKETHIFVDFCTTLITGLIFCFVYVLTIEINYDLYSGIRIKVGLIQ